MARSNARRRMDSTTASGKPSLVLPLLLARRTSHEANKASHARTYLTIGATILGIGLLLTLPWSFFYKLPTGTPRMRLPYIFMGLQYLDVAQPMVTAVAGICLSVTLLILTGNIMLGASRAKEVIDKGSSWKALPLRRMHSFQVRLQCLLFVWATRLALEAGICFAIAGRPGTTGVTGAAALMLLLASVIVHGGDTVLLFILFGVGEGIFMAPARWLEQFQIWLLPKRKQGYTAEQIKDALQEAMVSPGYHITLSKGHKEREKATGRIEAELVRRRGSMVNRQAMPTKQPSGSGP